MPRHTLRSMLMQFFQCMLRLRCCKSLEGWNFCHTLVWLLSMVDSHVNHQTSILSKCFATDITLVWFLSTVNSAVQNTLVWLCESFIFKLFLTRMSSPVYCQQYTATFTFATFCALVFTSMSIHYGCANCSELKNISDTDSSFTGLHICKARQ